MNWTGLILHHDHVGDSYCGHIAKCVISKRYGPINNHLALYCKNRGIDCSQKIDNYLRNWKKANRSRNVQLQIAGKRKEEASKAAAASERVNWEDIRMD